MKTAVIQLLAIAACEASVIGRRDDPPVKPNPAAFLGPLGGILESLKGKDALVGIKQALPKAKLAGVTSLKPRVHSDAKRIAVRFGPYTLTAKGEKKPKGLMNSLDPNGQAFVDVISDGLCRNCTILSGRTDVVFEDGSVAGPPQGIYIHHIVDRDFSKLQNLPVTKCGVGQTPPPTSSGRQFSEFLAQGDDSAGDNVIMFTSKNTKLSSGYFFGPELGLMKQMDLVNLNTESKNVYAQYDIEYVEGHVGSDAAATLMSVTGCAIPGLGPSPSAGIKLDPKGIAITESPKFNVTKDSKIVAANGHMHDGGSKMILLINGKEVCESNAIYGKGGENYDTILRMSPCPDGISLKKGDNIVLKSVYDLATHPLREGGEHNSMGTADVMGMFYITFSVD